MDQENKNSENRFIVQCTLCIFTNTRSANKLSLLLVKKRRFHVLIWLHVWSTGSYYVLLRHIQHVSCENKEQIYLLM